jgi:archaellum biogenesis ATPase FlaH
MKKFLVTFCFISAALMPSIAQDKKAEREAATLAAFEKVLVTIETRDYVIIVDNYDVNGVFETNTDVSNFLSYEKEFVYLQGMIIAGNNNTNKLTVSDYNQVTDKKGNVKISMQTKGFFITAKIEMTLKKTAGNVADVIITPTKGTVKRFSGEVVPRAESKYFKRPGEI